MRRTRTAPIVALVPIYNEGPRVLSVLEQVAPRVDALLVVDDGSTDDGPARVRAWAREREDCALLALSHNQGKARACGAGFATLLAWQLPDDSAIVQLDGDGQHDPRFIPALVDRLERADLVIGQRRMGGYPLHKRFGNRVLSGWGALWSGRRFADLECGMRALRCSALQRLLPWYRGRGYSGEHELGVLAAHLGLRIDDRCPVDGGPYVAGARARDALPVMWMGAQAALRVRLGRSRPCPPPAHHPPAPPALGHNRA